jgi:tetratricopeptide (TPR) repeat protein
MGKKKKGKKSAVTAPTPARPTNRWFNGAVFVLAAAGLTALIKLGIPSPEGTTTTNETHFKLEPEQAVYRTYAGSESCRECHQEAFNLWTPSNHALAERPPNPGTDRQAFENHAAFSHGGVTSEPQAQADTLAIKTLGFDHRHEAFQVAGVIGHEPLRQFLVPHEGGRLQAVDTAFDPHNDNWFSVYGEEDRRPGEWGHWTGRGMTWNSMCASCHNTRLRKNYDPNADVFETTMAEQSVGCEACHGPMKAHVDWQHDYEGNDEPDPTLKEFSRHQILDTCGSCHSRRAELTGDFHPGESYHDHYNLTVPDDSDIFYPDGQVRDEDYVFTSFLSSRMHAAGVHCLDCHQPHTTKTILPGNALCLRCHNGSFPNSPKIDPVAHSHHQAESTGNQCVNCHMPQTTYMERHPRRDHGFTIPDPQLTKQLGIPNACNRCHEDQDTDWAIAAAENWYGDRLERPTRQRAQWFAAARQGLETAREPLVQLLLGDETPVWKAGAAHLLGRWLGNNDVQRALLTSLNNTNALVRSHAAIAIAPLVTTQRADIINSLESLLEDPARNVRVNAAWALRQEIDPLSPTGHELVHYLNYNADQPTGQMQLGAFNLAQEKLEQALEHYTKAATWDPNSPPIRHELAIILSTAGRHQEALKELQAACRLDPTEGEYQYKLALAWNELGDMKQTIEALRKAVELTPRHGRAWYNLGLALNGTGDAEAAVNALVRGESAVPDDPDIPYARATILLQLGRIPEAEQAARRALAITPNYGPAQNLLNSLSRTPGFPPGF